VRELSCQGKTFTTILVHKLLRVAIEIEKGNLSNIIIVAEVKELPGKFYL
jgi:hypothetical protein